MGGLCCLLYVCPAASSSYHDSQRPKHARVRRVPLTCYILPAAKPSRLSHVFLCVYYIYISLRHAVPRFPVCLCSQPSQFLLCTEAPCHSRRPVQPLGPPGPILQQRQGGGCGGGPTPRRGGARPLGGPPGDGETPFMGSVFGGQGVCRPCCGTKEGSVLNSSCTIGGEALRVVGPLLLGCHGLQRFLILQEPTISKPLGV